uniref:RING-type domain-containing protein n=1 Tax=Noctiluca scintillans TaxID=2966 RepID=A0A6T9E0I7_NOCSC|mmetsp:Transcript_52210/g.139083  ORF Transcript_52210/g.139083 Transcript_52210/m.139083 type:complete len:175 (+) Transcript_52210:76-600(+)
MVASLCSLCPVSQRPVEAENTRRRSRVRVDPLPSSVSVTCEWWPWSRTRAPQPLQTPPGLKNGQGDTGERRVRISDGVPSQFADLLFRDIQPEDYDLLLQLDDKIPRRTATKASVEGLGAVSPNLGERCTVCLTEYEMSDSVALLPCGHTFHRMCISRWLLERRSACPICANGW